VSRFSLLLLALSMLGMTAAWADGTEQLAAQSGGASLVPVTELSVAGKGLRSQPATIELDVTSEAPPVRIDLYWEAWIQSAERPEFDDQIELDGETVTGEVIGGPTRFWPDRWTATHRADITDLIAIEPGANTFEFDGLERSQHNDGFAIVVQHADPASTSRVQLVDGNDFAYHFSKPTMSERLLQTVPQMFEVVPTDEDRLAELVTIVASATPIGRDRPHALLVESGGVAKRFDRPFVESLDGEFDVVEFEIEIPAGADQVTVEVDSVFEVRGSDPSSLVWMLAGLTVPDTPAPPVVTAPPTADPACPFEGKDDLAADDLDCFEPCEFDETLAASEPACLAPVTIAPCPIDGLEALAVTDPNCVETEGTSTTVPPTEPPTTEPPTTEPPVTAPPVSVETPAATNPPAAAPAQPRSPADVAPAPPNNRQSGPPAAVTPIQATPNGPTTAMVNSLPRTGASHRWLVWFAISAFAFGAAILNEAGHRRRNG